MPETTTKNISYKKEEIDQIVNNFFETYVFPKTIFLFFGDLGAGKTTFIKSILSKKFGIKDSGSPTFTYVNSYLADKLAIHHLDLYRIKKYEDFYNLGLQTLFDQNNAIFFIEWPEILIENLEQIKEKFTVFKVKIDYQKNTLDSRDMFIEKIF